MQSESPRVLLIGPLPPPSGGMANQTRQLYELLVSEGVDAQLVQVNTPYRPEWIGTVRALRAVFRLVPYVHRLWRGAGWAQVMHIMANSGWSWHLFAAPALVVAWCRGVSVVVNYRGGEAGQFLKSQRHWVVPLLRRADVLAVPSGFLAELFRQYGLRPTIIPNVVDLNRFHADHEQSPDFSRNLHLVVTRNLEALYDNFTALRAFAHLLNRWPNARLTIAGSGPERENLIAESAYLKLGEAVNFTGRLERDAMARLYASAHIMLNPSRADNTPNSILEAWASGVVVVSTRVGGVPYLVQDGKNGILVPVGDPEAMAEAIDRIVSNPARWASLRSAGLRSAESFSWHRIRLDWLQVYQSLAKRSKSQPLVE